MKKDEEIERLAKRFGLTGKPVEDEENFHHSAAMHQELDRVPPSLLQAILNLYAEMRKSAKL